MTRRWKALAVIVALPLLLPEAASAQCAMCRRALESLEAQGLASALRVGILVLFAAPFAAFGAVATLAVRDARRRPDPQ
jgi:hypothetical protein